MNEPGTDALLRRLRDGCHNCGRLPASESLWKHEPGCECAECRAHCWDPTTCATVEWRDAAADAIEGLRREVYDLEQALGRTIEERDKYQNALADEQDATAQLRRELATLRSSIEAAKSAWSAGADAQAVVNAMWETHGT